MSVDGRTLCHARTADFFNSKRPLYFQLGNEVAQYGDHIGGTLGNVQLKRDSDERVKP
jgi:hypothetical protein